MAGRLYFFSHLGTFLVNTHIPRVQLSLAEQKMQLGHSGHRKLKISENVTQFTLEEDPSYGLPTKEHPTPKTKGVPNKTTIIQLYIHIGIAIEIKLSKKDNQKKRRHNTVRRRKTIERKGQAREARGRSKTTLDPIPFQEIKLNS